VGLLVFDELVDVVLGPVLTGGDFEDKSNDKQCLLGVPAGDHLGGREEGWGSAERWPTPRHPAARRPTCRMVKFSSTLFIMYFSGRRLSLWMKLTMYSQSGDRWMRYV
jgi:hypothetical protein